MKPAIGTICTTAGKLAASITVRRTRHWKAARTKWSHIFFRLRRMIGASTTTFRPVTLASTQTMPHGWKITAACQTGWLAVLLALPWLTR